MARRSLSTQGRILAAGMSVAAGGALIGFMAAGDHRADAADSTAPAASSSSSTQARGDSGATPYDGFGNAPTGNGGFAPQPQTRTGGS